MKRGTKTKPLALEQYQGNPGHKTKAELQDHIVGDAMQDMEPPRMLDAIAKKEWKRVAPILAKYNILTDLDRNTLILYCQSWSDYVSLTATLRELGATYESEPSGM